MFESLFSLIAQGPFQLPDVFALTANLPWIIVAAFAVFVVLWLLSVLLPGFPGVAYGTWEVRTLDGQEEESYTGNLVDCTQYFIGPAVWARFKPILSRLVEEALEKDAPDAAKKELQALRAELNDAKDELAPQRHIRVLGLRHWVVHKDVFIQFSAVDRDLDRIAFREKGFKFTLKGIMTKHILQGYAHTIPDKLKVPNVGSVTAHLFSPITAGSVAFPKSVERLALFVRPVVEKEERLEILEVKVDAHEKKAKDAKDSAAALAMSETEMDRMLTELRTEPGEKVHVPRTKTSLLHVAVMVFAIAAGHFIGAYFGVNPLAGAIVAFIVAFAVLMGR